MSATYDLAVKVLSLLQLRGVGSVTVNRLARSNDFFAKSFEEVADSLRKDQDSSTWAAAIRAASDQATAQIESAVSSGVQVLAITDPEYPPLLAGTPDAPAVLYVKGNLRPALNKSVAVIGTREPTAHGVITGQRITGYFCEQGWSIVSGLALGCDAVAHQSAISTSAHTVAVLAHGLQTIAPRQHQWLADEIVHTGGALVTEYAFGVKPFGPQYVKRDRIQAGLASGVVMIQSDEVGGSLHASRASLEYGRILAAPCPTSRDVAHGEAKITANLILCGEDKAAKNKLLRCKDSDLERVFPIRSKSDYPALEDRLTKKLPTTEQPAYSLL